MPALATRPLVREAVYLHQIAQLSDADIARATGVARSTARAWLADARSPTGQRGERLIELSAPEAANRVSAGVKAILASTSRTGLSVQAWVT